jgi:hypothetical protein
LLPGVFSIATRSKKIVSRVILSFDTASHEGFYVCNLAIVVRLGVWQTADKLCEKYIGRSL